MSFATSYVTKENKKGGDGLRPPGANRPSHDEKEGEAGNQTHEKQHGAGGRRHERASGGPKGVERGHVPTTTARKTPQPPARALAPSAWEPRRRQRRGEMGAYHATKRCHHRT